MRCPLCGSRKARRACPGVGQTICPVCCGTKRLVEIACPADCRYLSAAREHPAAVVRRQQESDMTALMPMLRGLSQRQHQVFYVLQTAIARHTPDGLAPLIDDDVADAAAALAATLETALRGVIYEHTPQSGSAQRLAGEMKEMLAWMRQQGTQVHDRDVAPVLRAIEKGAREVRLQVEGKPTAYLELMARVLRQAQTAEAGIPLREKPRSSLIIP